MFSLTRPTSASGSLEQVELGVGEAGLVVLGRNHAVMLSPSYFISVSHLLPRPLFHHYLPFHSPPTSFIATVSRRIRSPSGTPRLGKVRARLSKLRTSTYSPSSGHPSIFSISPVPIFILPSPICSTADVKGLQCVAAAILGALHPATSTQALCGTKGAKQGLL